MMSLRLYIMVLCLSCFACSSNAQYNYKLLRPSDNLVSLIKKDSGCSILEQAENYNLIDGYILTLICSAGCYSQVILLEDYFGGYEKVDLNYKPAVPVQIAKNSDMRYSLIKSGYVFYKEEQKSLDEKGLNLHCYRVNLFFSIVYDIRDQGDNIQIPDYSNELIAIYLGLNEANVLIRDMVLDVLRRCYLQNPSVRDFLEDKRYQSEYFNLPIIASGYQALGDNGFKSYLKNE